MISGVNQLSQFWGPLHNGQRPIKGFYDGGDVILHQRPVIVGHVHKGNFSTGHVLLVLDRLVAGKKHIEARSFGGS